MRVIQVLPCLKYGDAVGNDTLALHNSLLHHGIKAEIFAEAVDEKLKKYHAYTIDKWKEPKKDDVLIYHLSIGWEYIHLVTQAKCKKIAIYHNITPKDFFRGYDGKSYENCRLGLDEIKTLTNVFDYILCDSEFNKNDLISYGFKCRIDVLPILIPFEDYKKKPAQSIIKRYQNEPGHNILFVGRVAPNKKIEDVIAAFSKYKESYDPYARLFLVGNYSRKDIYYRRLQEYVDALKLTDVYFSGHIKFNEILAYYRIADVFLCMSEHEGFCVPLVESMFFQLPVIAYDSSAVGDTLGGAGIMFKQKNFNEVAALINRVATDETLRREMISAEIQRLSDFDNIKVENLFIQYFNDFLRRSA